MGTEPVPAGSGWAGKNVTIRLYDTAGSPSRRRPHTWRSLFFAPWTSLRPCLGQGASWRVEGWAGKKVACAHPAGDSDSNTARELIAAYYATIEFFRSLLEGHHGAAPTVVADGVRMPSFII